MRQRAVGYIVVEGDSGQVLGHYDDTPRAGILVTAGNSATVFGDKRTAQRAIDRTNLYADEKRMPWGTRSFRIVRLETPNGE